MSFVLPTINTGDDWTAANSNTYWRDPLNILDDWPAIKFVPGECFADTTGNNATVTKVEGSVIVKPSWYVSEHPANLNRSRSWQYIIPDFYNERTGGLIQLEIWWYGSQQADSAKFVRWEIGTKFKEDGDALTGGYTESIHDADGLSTAAANVVELYEDLNFLPDLEAGKMGFFRINRDGPNDDAVGIAYLISWRLYWELAD